MPCNVGLDMCYKKEFWEVLFLIRMGSAAVVCSGFRFGREPLEFVSAKTIDRNKFANLRDGYSDTVQDEISLVEGGEKIRAQLNSKATLIYEQRTI